MMSIGAACDRAIKSAEEMRKSQRVISEYCNTYARKVLGNEKFEFKEMPDSIVESIFYGFGDKTESWSSYLKKEVRNELKRIGYNI